MTKVNMTKEELEIAEKLGEKIADLSTAILDSCHFHEDFLSAADAAKAIQKLQTYLSLSLTSIAGIVIKETVDQDTQMKRVILKQAIDSLTKYSESEGGMKETFQDLDSSRNHTN